LLAGTLALTLLLLLALAVRNHKSSAKPAEIAASNSSSGTTQSAARTQPAGTSIGEDGKGVPQALPGADKQSAAINERGDGFEKQAVSEQSEMPATSFPLPRNWKRACSSVHAEWSAEHFATNNGRFDLSLLTTGPVVGSNAMLFIWRPAPPGDFRARLTFVTNLAPGSVCGIAVRNADLPQQPFFAVGVSANGLCTLSGIDGSPGQAMTNVLPRITLPVEFCLTRGATNVTVKYSYGSRTQLPPTSVPISLSANMECGLVIGSGGGTNRVRAVFESVSPVE
jgi:hypothetical protein